ncbi:MAG: TonB-dependent receptor [Ignavibacteria bacterium]|nr:TonB-dependent receptor [Ignavibacteria bacterium]
MSRFLSALLIAGALLPATLTAQQPTGHIRGSVLDRSTLEPIPGATVTILGTTLGAAADPDGLFLISGISVGTYRLRVSAVGYAPAIIPDIVVASGHEVEVAARLNEVSISVDEIEVRASYFQKTPDAPVSYQQLSYEEIRRFPGGFEDVVRAVSVLPGVAQAEPGRNDLVVRGGAPSENLYVVDNIEIPNINHFGTQGSGGGPLSYINLDFVRETSFSTGGFGVAYGDRLSSVLTIDLQEGRKDAIGGKGTISATQFGLNLQGPVNDEASFVLSARRSYLDFIFRGAGFSFVPEYWDFMGKATYRPDRFNRFSFLAIGAIDDVNFFDDTPDNRYDNSRILGTAQKQYASGLSWQHLLGDGFFRLTLGRSWVRYNGVQRDSLLNPIFTNQSTEGETSLKADMVLKMSSATEISFGGQAKLVRFETDLALPDYESTFGDTLDVIVTDYHETAYKGALFAQVSQQVGRQLEVTVGARIDYFSIIDNSTSVSPRVSFSYSVTPVTTLGVAAGVYRQAPSSIWLATNQENRGLLPSRTDQYILSAEHLLKEDLKIRVEGFYKRYTDYPASVDQPYLVLANTGGGFGGSEENFASYGPGRLVSDGEGRAYGVEFLIQKKLSEIPLYGILSLTLSDTRFTPLDGIARAGTYDQPVIFNLSAGYRLDERWEFAAKFRFASGKPYTPFNADGTQNSSAYNSLRMDDAHSLDVRVDRRWNFTRWNLILYLDIQNIYNNKYMGGVRWDPRSGTAIPNESGIGILPTIGVSAEF